jgi:hypothetical protein
VVVVVVVVVASNKEIWCLSVCWIEMVPVKKVQ